MSFIPRNTTCDATEYNTISSNGNLKNPYIKAPHADYGIQMNIDLEYAQADAEEFRQVIKSGINLFRSSVCYKGYKNFLMSLGLDHCQVMGNINSDMADLEMHHNGITIFDIGVMIAYHIILVRGSVNECGIFRELRRVHTHNQVPLVMLCETVHQLYHDDELCLPASMCIGNWMKLITTYRYGITYGIAKKLFRFIDVSCKNNRLENNTKNYELLALKKSIKDWSVYNECGSFVDYGSQPNYNYKYDYDYIESEAEQGNSSYFRT